jgi:hypothetical protein
MLALILQGIDETKPKEIPIQVILKESDAISYAYVHATPGSLITVMCDEVSKSIEQVKKLKEDEDRRLSEGVRQ